jgi:hypothetical protein
MKQTQDYVNYAKDVTAKLYEDHFGKVERMISLAMEINGFTFGDKSNVFTKESKYGGEETMFVNGQKIFWIGPIRIEEVEADDPGSLKVNICQDTQIYKDGEKWEP